MSVINVQPSRSAAGSVIYVLRGTKKDQQKNVNRAAAFAISLQDAEPSPESFIARAEALADAHGRKNQLYNYVLAFSPEEFDVSSQKDLERVRDIAVQLAERMHAADYLIAVHADSAGGHAHAHILIMNHDNLTGKSLRKYKSWRHGLHQLNDELMREEGLATLPEPTKRKPDWEIRREQFATGGFEQSLGDKVFASLTDPRAIDQEAFEKILAEQGVKLAITERDGWSYKMRRSDNNRIGRKKASALTPEFTSAMAHQIFSWHAKHAQEKADPDLDEPLFPSRRRRIKPSKKLTPARERFLEYEREYTDFGR